MDSRFRVGIKGKSYEASSVIEGMTIITNELRHLVNSNPHIPVLSTVYADMLEVRQMYSNRFNELASKK